VSLVSLFPLSTPEESFAAMTDLVVEHGNGAAVAASLGCALSSFKNHKSRLKKLLEQAQEQGQG
jgi:prefoldin subunit 5